MGSGVSTGIQAAIQASDEDLKAALQELPPCDRKKLLQALASAEQIAASVDTRSAKMEPSQTTEASQISLTVRNMAGTDILKATFLPSDSVSILEDQLAALGEVFFKLSYNGEVVTNHEITIQELGVSTDDVVHLIRVPCVRVIASPSTEGGHWYVPEFREKVAPGFDVEVAIEDSTTLEDLRKSVCKQLGVSSDWVNCVCDETVVIDFTGCLPGTPRQLVVDSNHHPPLPRGVENTHSFPLSDFGVKGGETLKVVVKKEQQWE